MEMDKLRYAGVPQVHTNHTSKHTHTGKSCEGESQSLCMHVTPPPIFLPSNIPLIGFWIHKMPPIR